jgi:Zn-dependent M28 family amino/carboxypeptidase
VPTENVMAYLEGTDKKEEVLVISSHYDHVGINSKGEINNGADDDGSGTVSVMEIAEAFATAAKEGKKPRRSILFLNVTGEEKGLLGSEYYSDHPIFPLANTVNNINIDMVGRIDYEYQNAENKDYVYVIGSEMLSSHLKVINEYNNITYTNLILDYRYDAADDPNRFYYRSDHYNFAKHNIPVIFFFNGVHDDYHQPTDTVDKIEFPLMTKRAKLIFHTAWDLANRAERTPVDGTNDR